MPDQSFSVDYRSINSERKMPATNPVTIALKGGRITSGLRAVIFEEAARAGVSVNELVLTAAAERLAQRGARFPGIFHDGDLEDFDVRAGAAQ